MPATFYFDIHRIEVRFDFNKDIKKSGINLPDTLFFYLNPECCIRGFYSLIIVSNILNLSIAVNACGALAGNTILSPAFTVKTCPFTTIFADPSNTCTKASNGALCSLSPPPLSNENKVMFPAGLLINCLLIIPPSEYSTNEARWSTIPFLNDCSIFLFVFSFYVRIKRLREKIVYPLLFYTFVPYSSLSH